MESRTFPSSRTQEHAMSRSLIPVLVLLVAMCGASAAENGTPVSADPVHQPSPKSVQTAPSSTTTTLASNAEDASAEAALLEAVNRSRAQVGLAVVRMDDSLREA